MLTKFLFFVGLTLAAFSIAGLILVLGSAPAVVPHQALAMPIAGIKQTPAGVVPSATPLAPGSIATPIPELPSASTPTLPVMTPVAQVTIAPIVPSATYRPYPPLSNMLPPQQALPQQGWTIVGTHIVRPGESLYCIGRAYRVDPIAIAAMNSLSFNQILLPGTMLHLPNVFWINMPPGPVCQAQFNMSLVPSTPTLQPSKPATALAATVLPSATQTPIPSIGSASATPAPKPTPLPLTLLQVEAEWPTRMRVNESDFVRLALIRGTLVVVSSTAEVEEHQTSVAPIATPIGTPGVPPAQAFGPQYKTCVAADLIGKAFEPKLTTLGCQWLDRDELKWEWSVSTDQLGAQYLHFNVVMKWIPEPPATEIVQQIWHDSERVEVEQPWIVAGQLTVLPIFGVVLGGFFTVPYMSERMKKRINR